MAEYAATLHAAEATRTMINAGVGGGTGLIEGLVVKKLAPAMGAIEPVITWGTLLGVPVLSAIAAMFTRGRTSEMLQAMAAGGSGVLGYTIPSLVQGLARGLGGGGQPLGGNVKQLTQGNRQGLNAYERQAARVGLEC